MTYLFTEFKDSNFRKKIQSVKMGVIWGGYWSLKVIGNVTNERRVLLPSVLSHCRRVMACLHEAIVAAIGHATDRRDDRLV